MKNNESAFQNYNRQFDLLYDSGDFEACFQLFLKTPYTHDSLNFYMLEKLNLNLTNYSNAEKNGLINCYVRSLESDFSVHTMMIIASLVEDILSTKELKKEVWDQVMTADLKDKELIKELFADLDVRENPGLCFELFQKYPDYGLLSELWTDYSNQYNEAEKDLLMENYASILNTNNESAKKAILYSIWVDFFEDSGTQADAWNRLMSQKLNKEALKGLLAHSGPVDFKLKSELIHSLIPDPEMHPAILDCLFGSLHDVFGHISFSEAKIIFEKLTIDGANERYTDLATNLYKFNSKEEYWNHRNKPQNNNA